MTAKKGLLLGAFLLLSGCAGPQFQGYQMPAKRSDVPPIRNSALTAFIHVDLPVRADTVSDMAEIEDCDNISQQRLADLGREDGNTFRFVYSETPQVNLSFYFNYQPDGNAPGKWQGTGKLAGWGWGDIAIVHSSGKGSQGQVVADLAEQMYRYIRLGWHQQ